MCKQTYEPNFRNARYLKKMTAEKASAELGVSLSTLMNWEVGKTCPDSNKVIDMAILYQVSADELLGISKLKYQERTCR